MFKNTAFCLIMVIFPSKKTTFAINLLKKHIILMNAEIQRSFFLSIIENFKIKYGNN